eukprot:NODE_2230_length_1170_cov_43.424621_g1849_i0.p2 GENE.NODE_2230_length_1170_cov_43.424621_g1849_i0~~NODE_2230_length_1170_cov_43.424621_g1849_i0.p2  ORF type:complete len:130 (+),score=4.28 NODE_2230_length_1170_cov_43.424621_g1849_i0:642-1031(+)
MRNATHLLDVKQRLRPQKARSQWPRPALLLKLSRCEGSQRRPGSCRSHPYATRREHLPEDVRKVEGHSQANGRNSKLQTIRHALTLDLDKEEPRGLENRNGTATTFRRSRSKQPKSTGMQAKESNATKL